MLLPQSTLVVMECFIVALILGREIIDRRQERARRLVRLLLRKQAFAHEIVGRLRLKYLTLGLLSAVGEGDVQAWRQLVVGLIDDL